MTGWGCSLDGCSDAIAKPSLAGDSIEIERSHVVPACAIIPEKAYDTSMVGEKAELSRICRGYAWPPEARFEPDNGLRRLPISIAWHLLVAASDRRILWRAGESTPLANIIADHVMSFLPEGIRDIVLAIPNDLHEFGQQVLISALKRRGCKPTLLWRPVAAAISWCNRLPAVEAKAMLEKDDSLIVIHLGADSFEFVPLRLRKIERNGIKYVVPLRTRPQQRKSSGGIFVLSSAAEVLIQKLYGNNDHAAIWQTFAVFPELWKIARGESEYNENNERFIHIKNTWNRWKPQEYLYDALQDAQLKSEWLEGLTAKCCDVDLSRTLPEEKSLIEYVRESVQGALKQCHGDVVGAMITGNLEHLPVNDSQTLKHIIFEELEKADLEYNDSSEPAGTYIFYPERTDIDLIAEGCLIYHDRISKNLPTYLDTLPKLDIRARILGKAQWCSLVKDDVIEGGETYENPSPPKFAVKPGQKEIEFFLMREDSDKYRKLPFLLPEKAANQIGLDLKVKMRPAQGYASVEVIPSAAKAFGSEHLYLDWSRMEPSELPKEQKGIGFPQSFSIEIHPNVYNAVKWILRKYLQTGFIDNKYTQIVIRLRDEIKQLRRVLWNIGDNTGYRIVNENGDLPCEIDTILMLNVKNKINNEIENVLSRQMTEEDSKNLKYLIQTSTWLFAGAPENCYIYLRRMLKENNIETKRNVVHGAGRSFFQNEDIELFFNVAVDRIRYNPLGTNNWVLAISRILQHRDNAPECLRRDQALFLAKFACDRMDSQLRQGNIKQIFKNSAHLFLFLLRWRTIGDFLVEGEESDLGQQAKSILENAAELSRNKKIKGILKEIAKYIEYEGDTIITGFPEDAP
ncbi:MAG: hypothetical protein JRJ38_18330 [Deltaproteobacteria bacterium]|nr:hypothetical protein [Deltaproteobacteria bacterium]